jgi:hypothetical protein
VRGKRTVRNFSLPACGEGWGGALSTGIVLEASPPLTPPRKRGGRRGGKVAPHTFLLPSWEKVAWPVRAETDEGQPRAPSQAAANIARRPRNSYIIASRNGDFAGLQGEQG